MDPAHPLTGSARLLDHTAVPRPTFRSRPPRRARGPSRGSGLEAAGALVRAGRRRAEGRSGAGRFRHRDSLLGRHGPRGAVPAPSLRRRSEVDQDRQVQGRHADRDQARIPGQLKTVCKAEVKTLEVVLTPDGPTRLLVAGFDKGQSFTKGTLTKTYKNV